MATSGFTESLTIGITLTLVFGAVCFYLYSRLVQNEKRVSLIESILLDVKMSMEMVGQSGGRGGGSNEDDMAVEQVEPVSGPEPLSQNDVDESEEEAYKDVLQQVSSQPEMKTFDLSGAKPTKGSAAAAAVEVTKVTPTYESMTVKELKELAKKRNLKTPHGAGRKELTEALRKTDVPVQPTVEGAPPLVEGALLEEEDAELTS
jgi:hypothetical protein